MHYGCFSQKVIAILVLFNTMIVSKIQSQDLYYIPGCEAFLGDLDEIVVKCTEFNYSSTPTFFPENTSSLYMYDMENLQTDIPLTPELKDLKKLSLIHDYINNISKVMFDGLESLIHLSLKSNFIKSIPSDAFQNTLNLEILDLSENYIISVESIAPSLRNLKKLKNLLLVENKLLSFLKDDDFILLEDSILESIDTSSCFIEFIEINTFKPLKSLSSLNISYNPLPEEGLRNISASLRKDGIKDLNAKAMTKAPYFSCRFLRWLQLTNITSLDLSENRFTCFPKGNYKYLQSLILNKCDIFEEYPISISEMPNLEYLEIKEHRLLGIDKEFKSNAFLKFLDLSYFVGIKNVNIFKIADYAFQNQNQLVFLYLQELPLQTGIKRYMLYNLTKLEKLGLYSSNIPAIECNSFETLNNLIYLDLSFNRILELSNCSFYGLTAINTINLANNMLSFISQSHPFMFTPKLEVLNLNSNNIVKLSPETFQKLNNLNVIMLSNNLIQPWHRTFLPRSKNMTVLIMDKNAISYFTAEMLEDVSDLDVFDFSRNPINCSQCSILDLKKWMMNNTSVIRNFNTDGAYVCSEPDTMLGVNIIAANLTLSYCFLKEKDILKIMCIVFSPIIFIIVISFIVWYRWSWNIKYYMFLIQVNTKKCIDNSDSRRYMFDACVFYCDADINWITKYLVPILENGNSPLRLCLPDRNFNAGVIILDNILLAITNSRSTVIVLSNNCLEDSWCLYNMQLAQNMMVEKSRNGLIVVLLEDIPRNKFKKDLQYVLSTRTCIWWTENLAGQKLFWKRLRLAIMRPRDRGISSHII